MTSYAYGMGPSQLRSRHAAFLGAAGRRPAGLRPAGPSIHPVATRRLPELHALPPHLQQLVEEWLELDRAPASRAVIRGLSERQDQQALEALLGQRLEFGTAGLRGLMGPGFSRMNAVTVQQTTQGLVEHLQVADAARARAGGVVIGEQAAPRRNPKSPSTGAVAQASTPSVQPPAQDTTAGATPARLRRWRRRWWRARGCRCTSSRSSCPRPLWRWAWGCWAPQQASW